MNPKLENHSTQAHIQARMNDSFQLFVLFSSFDEK